MSNFIYLDYAAATPLNSEVLAAMQPYFSQQFYNPSATYLPAQTVTEDIEKTRAKVAAVLGVRPSEIIFTAGGTEANNLAIHGVMKRNPRANVIVSAIEHESVIKPAKQYKYKLAPVQPNGRLDLKKLQKLIDDKTVLVSVMYANNEIGTVEPIRETAQLVKTIRQKRLANNIKTPLLLHTDACQAGAYLDLHVSRLGVDIMTLNGGKIYGPKQTGALYVRAGIELKPQIIGGGQEHGLRSGTENVAGIIGFATALELVQKSRAGERKRLSNLQNSWIELLKTQIPKVKINGSLKHRLPNNVHLTISGHDNERLLIQLEQKGVLAAAGSACSASSDEPSHVLTAIGLSVAEAQASLRFSMGNATTEEDLVATTKVLKTCLK